ncbi:hypothetical protein GCM10019016_085030 [Streptomyces prasinosporus]|uniref:Uncharacterized protein n=1 Tax=Streptomyces prasinosporus TaxID=68256 RepID=A0ABP6U153_9ACTN
MPNSSGLGTRVRQTVTRAPLFLVEIDQLGEVEVGQRVAGDDEESIVLQCLLGVLDASGGTEWLLLVGIGELHPELLAVTEVVLDQ